MGNVSAVFEPLDHVEFRLDELPLTFDQSTKIFSSISKFYHTSRFGEEICLTFVSISNQQTSWDS